MNREKAITVPLTREEYRRIRKHAKDCLPEKRPTAAMRDLALTKLDELGDLKKEAAK